MKRSSDKKNSEATTTRQPLSTHEWNFRDVPNDELEACYLYEYAREFFKSSKHLQKLRQEWNDPSKKRDGKHLTALTKAWDLLQTRRKNFPYIDFNYFPKIAWQDLSVLPKTAGRRFKMNLRRDATGHVNEWAIRHRECATDRLHIETLRQCEPPNIRTIESFRDYHQFFHCKQDLIDTEYGFFAINWDFKDSQIIEAFKHWLNEQRKARRTCGLTEAKHIVSRGGFTDRLNWLGALRATTHYRHKDLVAHADTKLKVHTPYSHYSDLQSAAKKARTEIKRLFPSQWNEKDFLRRQREEDLFLKKHPLVIPEALLQGNRKGVSSKS